jgi:hypothetical protein
MMSLLDFSTRSEGSQKSFIFIFLDLILGKIPSRFGLGCNLGLCVVCLAFFNITSSFCLSSYLGFRTVSLPDLSARSK